MDNTIASSQERFRRANEELERRYGELAAEGELPFICECGNTSCTRVVPLTLDEYLDVRSTPGRFAILPGHEAPGERVVEANDRFGIAERRDHSSPPRP